MSALQDMAPQGYGWHSRGYLPHFDGGSIPQSITFRLCDSLPKAILDQWSRELSAQSSELIDIEMRKRIAAYLDQGHGRCYLKVPRVAKIVQNAMLFFDKEKYLLSAWVVMPNHVHMVMTQLPGETARWHHAIAEVVYSKRSEQAIGTERSVVDARLF